MNTPVPPADDFLTASSGPLNAVRRFLHGWDRFWFGTADPTLLGLIRVCTGLVMLFVHLSYSYDLLGFVGPQAWLDERAAQFLRHDMLVQAPGDDWSGQPEEVGKGMFTWSIFYHLRDPQAIWAAHVTILVIILLFTLGVCTRITSVLAWAGGLCYIQRIPTQLFGMDTMQTVLLTYLMIGPSGAAVSLDRWWYLRRERRKRRQPDWSPPPAPSVSANLALRLMQVHFCFMYLAAGTSKLLGPAWWNGRALWLCLANYSFAPMEFSAYNALLRFLVSSRLLTRKRSRAL
jgi:hypothetical protein